MSGVSFLRRVSLHGFRGSLSRSKSNEPQPEMDQPPSQQPLVLPKTQTVLLLHAARQPYDLTEDYPVPELRDDHEVLVRTRAIGLNPVDWKAP